MSDINKKEEKTVPVPYKNERESEETYKIVTPDGRPKTLGWSVVSLIFAILSVLFSLFSGITAIILGVLAIVFSVVSRKKLGYFDIMALIGLIVGIFGSVIGVGVIVAEKIIESIR